MGLSAAAMVLTPTLGPALLGTGEGAEDLDTEITPPAYAFSIWGPIFASVAVNASHHATHPGDPVHRRTGWWLTGAYGANAAWSVAAQSNRFRHTPFVLSLAAGLAAVGFYRAQAEPARGSARVVPHSAGLLLGWTGVASVVNAFAVRRHGRLAATTRSGRRAARIALTMASTGIATIIGASRQGHSSVASAAGWALVTSAANSDRTQPTRVVSAAGAGLTLGTSAAKLLKAGTRARSCERPPIVDTGTTSRA